MQQQAIDLFGLIDEPETTPAAIEPTPAAAPQRATEPAEPTTPEPAPMTPGIDNAPTATTDTPEPDAWTTRSAEEKKEYIQGLKGSLERLAAGIVTDPERLAEFSRRWTAGLHRYSFSNTILAWAQMPDGINGTHLAGFHTWQKLGRKVKKGQTSVRVYAPMFKKAPGQKDADDERLDLIGFRLVPVFFLEQTEGKPLDIGCGAMITGKEPVTMPELKNIFSEYTWTATSGDFSNGWTDGKRINVADRPDHPAAMFSTAIHEITHCRLHLKKDQSLSRNDGETIARDVAELEAEAVAFIVCSFFGIENEKAALYIGGWKGEAARGTLDKAGSRILRTAEYIIRRIETSRGTEKDNRIAAGE